MRHVLQYTMHLISIWHGITYAQTGRIDATLLAVLCKPSQDCLHLQELVREFELWSQMVLQGIDLSGSQISLAVKKENSFPGIKDAITEIIEVAVWLALGSIAHSCLHLRAVQQTHCGLHSGSNRKHTKAGTVLLCQADTASQDASRDVLDMLCLHGMF